MKHNILILFILFMFPALLYAQSKQSGIKLGFHIMPTFSKSAVVSGSSDPIKAGSNVTYKQVADSVKKKDKMAFSPGFGLTAIVNLKRDLEFQTGLFYYETGFVRTISGLKFLDDIYPGGGKIFDNSNDKTAYFHYRFKYLHLPLMFNLGIPLKNINFQYNFYATGGLGINYLLDQDIKARLEGFTMGGKDKLTFDSTGFDTRKLTAHASLGFRFEYLMKNKFIFSVQPLFNYNIIAASSSELKMQPYSFTVAAGINYRFHKLKEEDKKN